MVPVTTNQICWVEALTKIRHDGHSNRRGYHQPEPQQFTPFRSGPCGRDDVMVHRGPSGLHRYWAQFPMTDPWCSSWVLQYRTFQVKQLLKWNWKNPVTDDCTIGILLEHETWPKLVPNQEFCQL